MNPAAASIIDIFESERASHNPHVHGTERSEHCQSSDDSADAWRTILIVEDDIDLARRLRDWLRHQHFRVEHATSAMEAERLLKTNRYDAIVLDWRLPDEEGTEICRRHRLAGGNTPVLILTGKCSTEDKVIGLDAGADDYLTKPFHVKELVARLRAVLRRPSEIVQEVLTMDDLVLDTRSGVVVKNGQQVKLSPREYSLLEFFMRRPGKFFSAQALLESVWTADSCAGEDTIRTYVKTLRRKISDSEGNCRIRTVNGMGYILDLSNPS
jgi:DNA-binding response OmpR family regulator